MAPPLENLDDVAPDAPAKINLSLGSRRPHQSAPVKRPLAMLQDDEIEEKSYQQSGLSHFGLLTEDPRQEKVARVIQLQPNREWRLESRRKRQKSGLPDEARAQVNRGGEPSRDVVTGDTPTHGLVKIHQSGVQINGNTVPEQRSSIPDTECLQESRTEDEQAMDALLGKIQQSNTVIAPMPATEDDAFRADYKEAPPMATLEQYTAMPVEEFGAALLRGQGWKEGEAIGKSRHNNNIRKERVVNKRPALLGLGAKESGLGVELGAWGKGTKIKGKNDSKRWVDEVSYNPIALKSKKTGEVLTEAEMRLRLADPRRESSTPWQDSTNPKLVREDGRFDGYSRSRDRHRDRTRDSDSERRIPRDRHRSFREVTDSLREARHQKDRQGDNSSRDLQTKDRRRYDIDDRYDSMGSRRDRYNSSRLKRDRKYDDRSRDYDRCR